MFDLSRKPPATITERLMSRMNKALELEESFQPARHYLGGSQIGKECERALQYSFTQASVDPGKDFTGRLIRVFARGHWVESAMVEWLRTAGFGLVAADEHGQQFGFEAHDGYMKGHTDGFFVSGPDEFGPWPRLWECKGLMQKYFLPIVKHGIKEKNPTYYGQTQFYMKKFNMTENPALFSVINMNTMELYWEEIPFDPNYFDMLDGKAARIIKSCLAGELLPRMTENKDFFKCKWCSYRERCFSNQ